ncbi:hypothetical protein BYT27DRAFT_7183952 [Phlegmacium glaucopus]|nr:hypothetical protein BYT27DRAFT_7183952 [Phlegmacium glaucopus]
MSQKYHFKSTSTNYYVTSTEHDANGQIITTVNGKDSVPDNSTLTVSPAIEGEVTTVTIIGVNNLYVALQGDAENTKLTWSDKEYQWIIRATQQGTYYINPANGDDLYWFDEFGIGAVVIAKAGKDVKPPEAEWVVTKV